MSNTSHPNIILITTDQQRFDTIASAGNPSIFTPHLDWMCDTGVRFDRCYSDCPVCVPARTTLMTGQHGWHHGRVANGGGRLPINPVESLPGRLTAAGYQTRAVGKMHFKPERTHFGFESMLLPGDYYREARERGWKPMEHGVGQNELAPVLSTVSETESLTHWTVRRSVDFLETRDTDRPFFLWTSFSKPHPPLDPPLAFWQLYDGITMPDPVIGDWSRELEDLPSGFYGPSTSLSAADRLSGEQLRAARRAYYACISHIDYSLGILFARLRELNLHENTWLIFTSDHGEMLGDHRMGAKCVFFEGSAHVPLIIKAPEGSPSFGQGVDPRLVCLADIAPTIHDIAGLPRCESMDGLSLTDSSCLPREELLGQHGDAFACLIQGQWKYLYAAPGGQELLFNLKDDPMEQKDLARSKEAGEPLAAMRVRLTDRLAEEGSRMVENHSLVAKPSMGALSEPSTRAHRWPGFHSSNEGGWSEVLH